MERLKTEIAKLLNSHNLSIYSLKKIREFDEWMIELRIDISNMDAETLASIHQEIVDKLDNLIDPNVYFVVSTKGAEYPLNTKDELLKEVGNYIYLKSPQYSGLGTLISFLEDIIILEINDKGRFRKIIIQYQDASKIRTSVKI